jgi:LysR family transcriptional regulator, pca operon transcriptional activator
MRLSDSYITFLIYNVVCSRFYRNQTGGMVGTEALGAQSLTAAAIARTFAVAFNDGLIKFRHVICLLEVVRQGSISRAAQALAIAQPALSRALAELEEIVGAKLIERTRRGGRLTAAGEDFCRYAAPGAVQIRQAYAAARPGSLGRGTVVIGALPEAMSLMPPAMASLRNRLPDTVLRVLHGTNAVHLASLRHGDIAFVIGRIAATGLLVGLAFEHLYSEAVCCVARAGHHLAGHSGLSAVELATNRLVLHQPNTIIRAEVDRFLFAHGVTELADHFETDSMALARRLALDDDRIWIAPMGVVSRDIAEGNLTNIRVRGWHISASVGITTDPKRKPTRVEETLIDILRQTAASAYGSGAAQGAPQ